MKGGERFMFDALKNALKAVAAVAIAYCLVIMAIVAVCDRFGLLEEEE